MRYFITGATGFIGRRLCKKLLRENADIVALVRSHDGELDSLGVEQIVGDLLDVSSFSDTLPSIDVVVHCAGDAVFGNGPHYTEINLNATLRLLDAIKLKAPGISRFVFVSTIGAVDRTLSDSCKRPLDESYTPAPTSDYGKSKLAAEKAIIESGIPCSIIRPTMVVGGGMRLDSHFSVFARAAIKGKLIARFRWPGEFSVIHVDDLCDALIHVSTHPESVGRVFFCAGESISLANYFDMCRRDSMRLPVAWLNVVLSSFSFFIPFQLKALMWPALTASDSSLRALGWAPKVPAEEALREVIQRESIRLDPELPVTGAVVITGAASGLGRAVALRLASIRNKIILVDKDEDHLRLVAGEIENAIAITCDLANEEEVKTMLESAPFASGQIDELYACAGFGARGDFALLDVDMQASMFKVNILSRLFLMHWLVRKARVRQFGRVVLISSSSAFQPLPLMTVYAASNAAVLFMGEGVASEVKSSGVSILTVCPGGMQTKFQRNAGVKEIENEKLMTPEEAAEEIMVAIGKQCIVKVISFRSLAMSLLARALPRKVSLALWHYLMGKLR